MAIAGRGTPSRVFVGRNALVPPPSGTPAQTPGQVIQDLSRLQFRRRWWVRSHTWLSGPSQAGISQTITPGPAAASFIAPADALLFGLLTIPGPVAITLWTIPATGVGLGAAPQVVAPTGQAFSTWGLVAPNVFRGVYLPPRTGFPYHQAPTAGVPVVGDPLNPDVIRSIINAVQLQYNAHDNDRALHLIAGPLASRPDPVANPWTLYLTSDSPRLLSLSDGQAWLPIDHLTMQQVASQPTPQFFLSSSRG